MTAFPGVAQCQMSRPRSGYIKTDTPGVMARNSLAIVAKCQFNYDGVLCTFGSSQHQNISFQTCN